MYLRVLACEIAVREICHLAALSPNVLDLEFLPQGYHDTPAAGRAELQRRIEATPAGKYDAILLGYGLCSNILAGLVSGGTPLVLPRAHDCIALFLGSKERYQKLFTDRPGTYYYTSGWLECRQRRAFGMHPGTAPFLPSQSGPACQAAYEEWVRKYGEEQARFLMEEMGKWAAHYTHGILIDFPFTAPLGLEEQVRGICAERGWQFDRLEGDLGLLRRWLDGPWDAGEFLTVPPGCRVIASYTDGIIGLEPATPAPTRKGS